MIQLLVMAKAPVPGRVKTRLCPPCTFEQAAQIAKASLADTLNIAKTISAVRHVLVLAGDHPAPSGWMTVPQRGDGLGERLAKAFADTAIPGVPSLLIGMDTPQVTTELLQTAATTLLRDGAVLGPAEDGGWWALGLSDPADATVLPAVPMSTTETGHRTVAALNQRGVEPTMLPVLRDVDAAADAVTVAALCEPGGRFPAVVAEILVAGSGVGRSDALVSENASSMTAMGTVAAGKRG